MASVFVTFTAPHHTSTSSTLDPHQILHTQTLPKKTKVKTNQQGREKKREKGNGNKPTGNRKKDIIESWWKRHQRRREISKRPLPFGRWGGFTASSFWRRSWRWRRRADPGPAQQTGGWHCLLCFLVSLRRIQKACWEWEKYPAVSTLRIQHDANIPATLKTPDVFEDVDGDPICPHIPAQVQVSKLTSLSHLLLCPICGKKTFIIYCQKAVFCYWYCDKTASYFLSWGSVSQ